MPFALLSCPKRIDFLTFRFSFFGPYLAMAPKGQPLSPRSFGQLSLDSFPWSTKQPSRCESSAFFGFTSSQGRRPSGQGGLRNSKRSKFLRFFVV